MSDYDARLVDLYDHDNPDGPDHDFYRSVADECGAESILDVGCGTGVLTVTFAREGREVVGIDPSQAMLAFARRRQGAEAVDWILGDSCVIPPRQFDVAVLTGNVVQHILDPEWQRTLLDLRAHLRTGGVLAFDTRNPGARAWEGWGSQERSRRDTPHGPLVEWADVAGPDEGVITARFHNQFLLTGESVTEAARFAFRHADTLGQQLAAAGFGVEAVYGDWARTPFSPGASCMVFIAHAR